MPRPRCSALEKLTRCDARSDIIVRSHPVGTGPVRERVQTVQLHLCQDLPMLTDNE